jgi:hypothetical protein
MSPMCQVEANAGFVPEGIVGLCCEAATQTAQESIGLYREAVMQSSQGPKAFGPG